MGVVPLRLLFCSDAPSRNASCSILLAEVFPETENSHCTSVWLNACNCQLPSWTWAIWRCPALCRSPWSTCLWSLLCRKFLGWELMRALYYMWFCVLLCECPQSSVSVGPSRKSRSASDWIPRPPEKFTLTGHQSTVTSVLLHPQYRYVCM